MSAAESWTIASCMPPMSPTCNNVPCNCLVGKRHLIPMFIYWSLHLYVATGQCVPDLCLLLLFDHCNASAILGSIDGTLSIANILHRAIQERKEHRFMIKKFTCTIWTTIAMFLNSPHKLFIDYSWRKKIYFIFYKNILPTFFLTNCMPLCLKYYTYLCHSFFIVMNHIFFTESSEFFSSLE